MIELTKQSPNDDLLYEGLYVRYGDDFRVTGTRAEMSQSIEALERDEKGISRPPISSLL